MKLKLRYKFTILFVLGITAIILHFTSNAELLSNEEKSTSLYPIMFIKENEHLYNVMYPYLNKMKVSTLSDSYTYFSPESVLSFYVPEQLEGLSIEYDLIETKTGTSLYNKKVSNKSIKPENDGSVFTIVLPNINANNEKYVLKFTYTRNNITLYYYQPFYFSNNSTLVGEALKTVDMFYQNTFNKNKDKIMPLLVSDGETAAKSFSYVNLSSAIESIVWDFGYDIIRMSEPNPRISYISPDSTRLTINLSYTLAVRKDYEFEYWDFIETYHLDQTENQFVITEFERKGNTNTLPLIEEDNSIYIGTGQLNKINHLTTSINKLYTAFIKNSELWFYDQEKNNLTKIFGFDQLDSDYIVDNYKQHKLRILEVTDRGKIIYGVYGYMNGGTFTAYNGLYIREYNKNTDNNKDLAFLPAPYDLDELDYYLENIYYYNQKLHISINETLYTINLVNTDYTPLTEIQPSNKDKIRINEKKYLRAWNDSWNKHNTSVHVLNLKNELLKTIATTNQSEGIHLIDVVDNTIITGVYDIEKTFEHLNGNVIYPYKSIRLYNEFGELQDAITPPMNAFFKTIDIDNENTIHVTTMEINEKIHSNPRNSKISFNEIRSYNIPMDIEANSNTLPSLNENIISSEYGDKVVINIEVLGDTLFEISVITEDEQFNSRLILEIPYIKEFEYYELYSEDQLFGIYNNIVDVLNMSKSYNPAIIYQTTGLTREEIWSSTNHKLNNLISGVPVIPQKPDLPRGCEVTALSMLLNYHLGTPIDKLLLAEEIKKDETDYTIKDGFINFGDMHSGFVGDMANVKNPGIGAYVGPVSELMDSYMPDKTLNITGSDFEDVLYFVGKGYPVFVITPNIYDSVSESTTQHWKTPNGIMEISYYEHSVIIVGYDQDYVYYNDPSKNIQDKKPISKFKAGWEAQGRQALLAFE